jgi:hypothetical protein
MTPHGQGLGQGAGDPELSGGTHHSKSPFICAIYHKSASQVNIAPTFAWNLLKSSMLTVDYSGLEFHWLGHKLVWAPAGRGGWYLSRACLG